MSGDVGGFLKGMYSNFLSLVSHLGEQYHQHNKRLFVVYVFTFYSGDLWVNNSLGMISLYIEDVKR